MSTTTMSLLRIYKAVPKHVSRGAFAAPVQSMSTQPVEAQKQASEITPAPPRDVITADVLSGAPGTHAVTAIKRVFLDCCA